MGNMGGRKVKVGRFYLTGCCAHLPPTHICLGGQCLGVPGNPPPNRRAGIASVLWITGNLISHRDSDFPV